MKPSISASSTGTGVRGSIPMAALILLVSNLALLLISGQPCWALDSAAGCQVPAARLDVVVGGADDGGHLRRAADGRSGLNSDDKQDKSDERHPSRSQSKREAASNKRDPPFASTRATPATSPASFQEPHGLESSAKSSIVPASTSLAANEDMATAAGHHYGKSQGGHGKYYMYAESPKKGAYKMGFRRGNHKHMIERKESAHKSHVHSYFKWHDKKGKGSHKFEFKHSDHKKKHHGHY